LGTGLKSDSAVSLGAGPKGNSVGVVAPRSVTLGGRNSSELRPAARRRICSVTDSTSSLTAACSAGRARGLSTARALGRSWNIIETSPAAPQQLPSASLSVKKA
jgi:hypothetical protein